MSFCYLFCRSFLSSFLSYDKLLRQIILYLLSKLSRTTSCLGQSPSYVCSGNRFSLWAHVESVWQCWGWWTSVCTVANIATQSRFSLSYILCCRSAGTFCTTCSPTSKWSSKSENLANVSVQPGSGQTKTVALSGSVFVSGLRTRDTLMGKNCSLVMSDDDFCGCTIKDL